MITYIPLTAARRSWLDEAACVGCAHPDGFHAGKRTPRAHVEEALALCESCPVRRDCRRVSFSRDDLYGIWGGTTEEQREQLRRLRNLKRTAA